MGAENGGSCLKCGVDIPGKDFLGHFEKFHVGPMNLESLKLSCGECLFNTSVLNIVPLIRHCRLSGHFIRDMQIDMNLFYRDENDRFQKIFEIAREPKGRLAQPPDINESRVSPINVSDSEPDPQPVAEKTSQDEKIFEEKSPSNKQRARKSIFMNNPLLKANRSSLKKIKPQITTSLSNLTSSSSIRDINSLKPLDKTVKLEDAGKETEHFPQSKENSVQQELQTNSFVPEASNSPDDFIVAEKNLPLLPPNDTTILETSTYDRADHLADDYSSCDDDVKPFVQESDEMEPETGYHPDSTYAALQSQDCDADGRPILSGTTKGRRRTPDYPCVKCHRNGRPFVLKSASRCVGHALTHDKSIRPFKCYNCSYTANRFHNIRHCHARKFPSCREGKYVQVQTPEMTKRLMIQLALCFPGVDWRKKYAPGTSIEGVLL